MKTAFIVFDFVLAIAILAALKLLTTLYDMVPPEHLTGCFSLSFSLVRITEHIRVENSLHNQKTQSGQYTGLTSQGMTLKHHFLDNEPALHILSKKLLSLFFLNPAIV